MFMLLYVSETQVKQSETSETIINKKVSKHLKPTFSLMLQLLQFVTKMLQLQNCINTDCYNCYKKNNVFIIYIYIILFFLLLLYYFLFSYRPNIKNVVTSVTI